MPIVPYLIDSCFHKFIPSYLKLSLSSLPKCASNSDIWKIFCVINLKSLRIVLRLKFVDFVSSSKMVLSNNHTPYCYPPGKVFVRYTFPRKPVS